MGAKRQTSRISVFILLKNSIWFFPATLTVLLVIMTAFKISGSSIGVYYPYFYGNKTKDPSLLLNRPRTIRSDEWLTNTQLTIAQKNDGYKKVNQNVGNGENTSIILDVPNKDWSTFFKPQNLVFFVLPFEYAFALKWWLMGYLLILSCYFFMLFLMPRRRLLAALVGLGLFFSPFIQWWYQYITLAPIYYSLFTSLAFMALVRTKNKKTILLLGLAITYLLVCFALVQYPPFQIACALAAVFFLIGYLLEQKHTINKKDLLPKIAALVCAGIVAGAIVLIFIKSNQMAYDATRNTAYPGHRNISSGGFDGSRLLSSELAFQFQFTKDAVNYFFPLRGIANQSEASNFIYLMPFLVIPEIALITYDYRKRQKINWVLLATLVLFGLLMIRMLTSYLSTFFKLMALNQVPVNRLLIGLGLLGIINLILLIRNLSSKYGFDFPNLAAFGYSLLVFIIEALAGKHIQNLSPGFVNTSRLLILCLPIPIIVYLLMRKRFVFATSVLLVFSILSAGGVNPLYRGTTVLTNNKLSSAVQNIAHAHNGRWVTQDTMLENFAIANGIKSLSGVYSYPQLEIWSSLDPHHAQTDIYNRFAHVDFEVGRQNDTKLLLRGGDDILATTGACSQFLKEEDVHFWLTDEKPGQTPTCAKMIDTVIYPGNSFYIYQLD